MKKTYGYISDKEPNKVFLGAGIIAYEKTDNNVYITLAKCSYYKQYTAMDGWIDEEYLNNPDALIITAKKEGFEESIGVINVNLHDIDQSNNYVDVPSGQDGHENKYYRIYFIRIYPNIISKKKFYMHKNILQHTDLGYEYWETSHIDKFRLKYLIKSGLLSTAGNLSTLTVKNRSAIIYERTVRAIRNAYLKHIFNGQKIICIKQTKDIHKLLSGN